MANPARNTPALIIYTRDASNGQLRRHSIKGMSKQQHIEHYNIGPLTDTERLTGWPERGVEWHGNTGYGIKG